MPGGPQMKTGRAGATLSRKSASCFCVTVVLEFTRAMSPFTEETERPRPALGAGGLRSSSAKDTAYHTSSHGCWVRRRTGR